jgi:hypothetical protein|tara:strand:+ start:257 stop:1282 length:1026 start_codon:yes stop_codon:yes gene_type:complete
MYNRKKIIYRLLKEGFTPTTLSLFSDKQLKQLSKKLFNEVETKTVKKTTYTKSEVDKIKQNDGGLSVDGTVTPNDDGSVTVTTNEVNEDDVKSDAEDTTPTGQPVMKQIKKDPESGEEEEVEILLDDEMSETEEVSQEMVESWIMGIVEKNEPAKTTKGNLLKMLKEHRITPTTMEMGVSFERLARMADNSGWSLLPDKVQNQDMDPEETLMLGFIRNDYSIIPFRINSNGDIELDNEPINDLQDFEEATREDRMEDSSDRETLEIDETNRDKEGTYMGAPMDTEAPVKTPVKTPTIAPTKPGRPTPFKRPKTTPKPKAKGKTQPNWFDFSNIKTSVETGK